MSAGDSKEAQAAAKLPLQNVGTDSGSAPPPGGNDRAPAAGLDGGNSSGNGSGNGGSDGSKDTVSAAAAAQPLELPPCDFGTELNFVGAWQGDSVSLQYGMESVARLLAQGAPFLKTAVQGMG